MKKSSKTALPGLFGLQNSNRDFSDKKAWGKNQFNSSFPASLACYMHSKNFKPVYLQADSSFKIKLGEIAVETLFGIVPTSKDAFFSFETPFNPYSDLIVGHLPRVDLVVMNHSTEQKINLSALEIKLTALPDHTTHSASDAEYGCELVVRPDTIVYLALRICERMRSARSVLEGKLGTMWESLDDWNDPSKVASQIPEMVTLIKGLLSNEVNNQQSLLMQPIWKTLGKTNALADDCFDIFVWSDLALLCLIFDACRQRDSTKAISRHERTVVWLFAMLQEFAAKGKFDHKRIIDTISLNTKNDKAFASSGTQTRPYMKCAELTKPRISKSVTKQLILNGGHRYLSPERRLDAAILATPGLFNQQD